MLAAGILLTIVGDDPWWTGLVALCVLLASIIPWCVTSLMLDIARYADGEDTVGTVTKVVADEDMGPDSNPFYDITVSAELAGGEIIRRTTRQSERTEPRPGQRIRFLHTTRDPDDLKDILFIEFVDEVVRRRGEGQS
ncbi:hypothetical protein [Jiangella sp. DSM 45060]|uniref:hypothetical protein n=1 Tax=Jiangella sp. DSM 45060 TaxID=1798224 RepID=UPI00087C8761|nr:hypothetical protein [Jiangella sp. DSM 45060]SDS92086.1 hypothetical protein SAMN04515669_2284 [Jiangella sp. DSM 45060]